MTSRLLLLLCLAALPALAQDSVRASLDELVASPVRDREGTLVKDLIARGPSAVDDLAAALADREAPAEVRAWAAFVLRQIGDPAAAPALVGALSDPSWRVRKAAAGALGTLGVAEGAIQPLLETLSDPDDSVNRSARGALDRLLVPSDLPRLAEALTPDRRPFARQTITLLAGQMDRPESATVLRIAVEDPDPETRQLAVFFLSRNLDAGAFEAVRLRLGDPSPEVRREAVRALIPAGTVAAAAILGAVDDPDPGVRAEACAAIGTLGMVQAGPRLAARLAAEGESPAVVLAAAEALWRLDRTSPVETARRVLDGRPGPAIRARVLRLLGSVPEPGSVEVLLGALDDPVRVVRHAASTSLAGLVGSPRPFDPEAPADVRAGQASRLAAWWRASADGYVFEAAGGPADPAGERSRYRVVSDLESPFADTASLALERISEVFESFYGWEEPAYRTDEGLEEGTKVEPDPVVRRIEFGDGRRVWAFADGARRIEFPWDEAVEIGPRPSGPASRTTVRVFRLRRDYRDYAARFDPKWPFLLDAGGYYSHARGEILTYDKPRREHVYATLVHEASHQVMRTYLAEAPVWLCEGLAEYFEHSLSGREGEFTPGGLDELHLAFLRKVLAEGGYTPLEDLVGLEYYQFHNDAFGPEEIGHYAQAWSLVHFLQHGDDGRHRRLLPRYLLFLREGASARHAWRHLIERAGLGGGALEERWKAHVLRLGQVAASDD